jgi:hypothetical protein
VSSSCVRIERRQYVRLPIRVELDRPVVGHDAFCAGISKSDAKKANARGPSEGDLSQRRHTTYRVLYGADTGDYQRAARCVAERRVGYRPRDRDTRGTRKAQPDPSRYNLCLGDGRLRVEPCERQSTDKDQKEQAARMSVTEVVSMRSLCTLAFLLLTPATAMARLPGHGERM